MVDGSKMWIEAVNVFGKWLTGLAAIGAVGVSLFQYLDQRKDEIAQRDLEIVTQDRQSKQKFLDKQFELYTEAITVVSRLATRGEYEGREKDRDRFWQLYWGELGMVEDLQVERAMIQVGIALSASEALIASEAPGAGLAQKTDLAQKTSEAPEASEVPNAKDALEKSSLDLSRCISKSIEVNWGVKLKTGICPYSDKNAN